MWRRQSVSPPFLFPSPLDMEPLTEAGAHQMPEQPTSGTYLPLPSQSRAHRPALLLKLSGFVCFVLSTHFVLSLSLTECPRVSVMSLKPICYPRTRLATPCLTYCERQLGNKCLMILSHQSGLQKLV